MNRQSSYSPDRRTAVVLSGTGVHGAYHAGVLRAFQEAGVKIDLLAGHGVGAANAAVAAIDGQARLWEAGGVWDADVTEKLYGWRPAIRLLGWLLILLAAIVLTPFVLVLVSALVVYPVGFALEMVGSGWGLNLIAAYSSAMQWALTAGRLPTAVPQLAMVVMASVIVLVVVGALVVRRDHRTRRTEDALWWHLIGTPIDAGPARLAFTDAIWQLIRGAAPADRPSSTSLGRRYAEVLAESLGQPGFREVLLVATDLDERRDVVAALLRDPFKHDFMAPRPHRDRRAEVLDLTDSGRDRAMDIVAAALTPPIACDPHLVTFSPGSLWRGEAHRLCDRPGTINRLLEEVAAAGVTQAIVVTANPSSSGPHQLRSSRLDVRHRIGEFVVAAESAALRDALEMARLRFDSVYVISPSHNPVGPFDATGMYDESSQRRFEVQELVDRAYEDAYRQFIEPVVGASGEDLARRVVAGDRAARGPEGLSLL